MEGNILQIVGSDIIGIVTPVSLCMLLVVLLIRTIPPQYGMEFLVLDFQKTSVSSTQKLGGALVNASIFICLIGGMTFVIFGLYYYRFMRFLKTYMYASILFVLVCSWGFIFARIIQTFEIPVDIISFVILLFNFTVLGMLSIFSSRIPIVISQFYKVMLGVSSAYCFSTLDELNTWALLIGLAVYDLLAVLTPRGPLKMLVDLASKRGEEIPGLIYQSRPSVRSATANNFHRRPSEDYESPSGPGDCNGLQNGFEGSSLSFDKCHVFSLEMTGPKESDPFLKGGDTHNDSISGGSLSAASSENCEEESEIQESKCLRLGLGDFIFYSVLVGRAAMYDLMTVYASYSAIISGLGCTLMLLRIFRRPLPALPISIGLGVMFYFLTCVLLEPLIVGLATNLMMF